MNIQVISTNPSGMPRVFKYTNISKVRQYEREHKGTMHVAIDIVTLPKESYDYTFIFLKEYSIHIEVL